MNTERQRIEDKKYFLDRNSEKDLLVEILLELKNIRHAVKCVEIEVEAIRIQIRNKIPCK